MRASAGCGRPARWRDARPQLHERASRPAHRFTRASIATYTDAGGTIRSAAINAPRWDYAGGSLRGVLIEEARTNVMLNSATFVGWSTGAVTLTPASGLAPDGTNAMVKLAEDNTNAVHQILAAYGSGTPSAVYTASIYAKAVENRYIVVTLDDFAANGSGVTFDLQAGIATASLANGSGTFVRSSIQPVGNGVYRCAVTGTVGASATVRMVMCLTNNSGANLFPSYPGTTGNGSLIWGAQLELGAHVTSYIPTTTAIVTRAMDSAMMPVGAWFTPNGFSLSVEFDMPPANNNNVACCIGDATPGNSSWINNSGFSGLGGGTSVTGVPAVTLGGAVNKQCATYSTTALRVCNNGGAVASQAFASGGMAAATLLAIGSVTFAPYYTLTGHVRRVQLWPRVLSNAEMQGVTS